MVDGSAEGAPFGATGVVDGLAEDPFVVSATGVEFVGTTSEVLGEPLGPPNEYD